MLVVNDSMVLIHLAKITLLEKSCEHFKDVIIPRLVFEETVTRGKEKGHEDASLIQKIVEKGKIKVRKVKRKEWIAKANEFNIQWGEAEAVALYWQENADLLCCDDDNVRSKKELLNLKLIGTPAIILSLYKSKKIDSRKTREALVKLQKIGWFSNTVIDTVLMEVTKK
jgi:predicted nucleic acid-binding protein